MLHPQDRLHSLVHFGLWPWVLALCCQTFLLSCISPASGLGEPRGLIYLIIPQSDVWWMDRGLTENCPYPILISQKLRKTWLSSTAYTKTVTYPFLRHLLFVLLCKCGNHIELCLLSPNVLEACDVLVFLDALSRAVRQGKVLTLGTCILLGEIQLINKQVA